MNPKYLTNLKDAIKSFWTTRSSVGVLPGKQLDEFLTYQAIIVQAKTGI